MLQLPIDDVIKKICEAKGLTEEEIKERIKAKVGELDGLVSEEGAAYIIASELGVQLLEGFEKKGRLKVKDVLIGMRSLDIAGRVVRKFSISTFKRKDKTEGKVGSFVIGDDTGELRVVLWDAATAWMDKLKENDIVLITGAYSRERGDGGKEIHLGRIGKLSLNPPDIDIPEVGAKRIELKAAQADAVIRAMGTIVAVHGVNFYDVCPECNKRLVFKEGGIGTAGSDEDKAVCTEHGEVKPKTNMMFSFVLDDATAALRCAIFREQASKLAGLAVEEAKAVLENQDELALREKIEERLLGHILDVEGRVRYNKAFDRTEIMINSALLNPDPKLIAERLMKGG